MLVSVFWQYICFLAILILDFNSLVDLFFQLLWLLEDILCTGTALNSELSSLHWFRFLIQMIIVYCICICICIYICICVALVTFPDTDVFVLHKLHFLIPLIIVWCGRTNVDMRRKKERHVNFFI